MPSRKTAQGKARKAAKADKAKEAALLPPKSFSEITLDSWLTCCDDHDNNGESERCHHGCDLSMPKSKHDCRDFAMRFASDYLYHLCRLFDNGSILKQMAKSKDLAVLGLQQGNSFMEAFDDLLHKHPDVFDDPSKVKWAISFYHSRGAQDVLDGNMMRARLAAICAEYLGILSSDNISLTDGKLLDVVQANDKAIFTYFRKRTSCSCLDEKREQYKGVKRTGICVNDECPLPGRCAERSSLLYCTGCKMAHYCSAGCQKTHWKYHKHQCACLAKLNTLELDENVVPGN